MASVPTWNQVLPDPKHYVQQALTRAQEAQATQNAKLLEQENIEKKAMWERAQTPISEEAALELMSARIGEEAAKNHIADLHRMGAFRDLGKGVKYTTAFDMEYWNRYFNNNEKIRTERLQRDLPLMWQHAMDQTAAGREEDRKLREKQEREQADYQSGGIQTTDWAAKRAPILERIKKGEEDIRKYTGLYMKMNPLAAHQLGMSQVPSAAFKDNTLVTTPESGDLLSGQKQIEFTRFPDSATGAAGANAAASGVETSAKSNLQTGLAMVFSDLGPGLPKGALETLDTYIKGSSLEDAAKGGGLDIPRVSYGLAEVVKKLENPYVQIPGVTAYLTRDSVTETPLSPQWIANSDNKDEFERHFKKNKKDYAKYMEVKIANALYSIAAVAGNIKLQGQRGDATVETQRIVIDLINDLRNPPIGSPKGGDKLSPANENEDLSITPATGSGIPQDSESLAGTPNVPGGSVPMIPRGPGSQETPGASPGAGSQDNTAVGQPTPTEAVFGLPVKRGKK